MPVGRPDILTRAAVRVATLFGAGWSPIAPGTAGTLVAIPPAVLLARLLSPGWFALATAVLALVAIAASGHAAHILGPKDPRPVVIDEAAGYFVTILYLPTRGPHGWVIVVTGFFLFRLMDVLKPFPARQSERLPGGWGIVTDDLIAGAYANVLLRLLALVPLPWGRA